jgi:hypothetical protein
MKMWRWNKNQLDDASFQRIEAEVFRTLEVSPAEIETAAHSPFLYRRLRVSIEAEARRRAETGREWLAWLVTARQATPALALVALLAIGMFWMFTERYTPTQPGELTASEVSGGVVTSDDLLSALAGWEKHNGPRGAENAGASAGAQKE